MKYVFGLLGAIITILVNIMINIIIIEVEVVVEQWFTTWLVSELTGGGGEVEWSGGERSGAGCKIYQSSLLLVLGNSKQKKTTSEKVRGGWLIMLLDFGYTERAEWVVQR